MKKNGFTLIELSIVALILGIFAVSAIPVSTTVLRSARIKTTDERLDSIESALEAYLISNGRLPCPADLEDVKSDLSFGVEKESSEICQSGSGHYQSGNLFYGAVPTTTLGLADSVMSDGWGNKISYVVDGRFSSGFETTVSDSNGMTMETENSSRPITTDAIYALISHGENEYGAFPLESGTQLSITGASSEEALNYYSVSPYTTTFTYSVYDEDFDDIVRYKTKMQLVMDIDWEDIGCAAEGSYESKNYGEVDDDGSGNCKKCYKYGRWGEEYTCP